MSIEGQGHFLPYIFQVLYVLCFSRPRYQVSVYIQDHWSSGYYMLGGNLGSLLYGDVSVIV